MNIIDMISTVGFPIALCLVGGIFGGKFFIALINRILDENKNRETKMYEFMTNISLQMEKITNTVEQIQEKLSK